MISIKNIQIVIVVNLQKELGIPVVLANQTEQIPPYPYVSFTVTSLVNSNAKTWAVDDDDTYFKPLSQTWSFTVQSDKAMDAPTVALQAYDWFSQVGCRFLSDNGVMVERVGNIGNRDNFLTTGYEYRCGFDVIFLTMHTTNQTEESVLETIEYAPIKNDYEEENKDDK